MNWKKLYLNKVDLNCIEFTNTLRLTTQLSLSNLTSEQSSSLNDVCIIMGKISQRNLRQCDLVILKAFL